MEITLKDRLKSAIKKSRRKVFLRDDFLKLGCTYRQLSRALDQLQREHVVVRAGYGLYMRPSVREIERGIGYVRERLGRMFSKRWGMRHAMARPTCSATGAIHV